MDFSEWLEENRERIYELVYGDVSEALNEAWIAGYEEGMVMMSSVIGRMLKSNESEDLK